MTGSPDAAEPCMMLVGVGPEEEARKVPPDAWSLRVLRVRHALPACERIRVTRPAVVLVGKGVPERDVDLLVETAHQAGSQVLALGSFIAPSALADAVERALARAAARRSADALDDLPDTKTSALRAAAS